MIVPVACQGNERKTAVRERAWRGDQGDHVKRLTQSPFLEIHAAQASKSGLLGIYQLGLEKQLVTTKPGPA